MFLYLANLTGHTEKVGMENFELLKVLGTGGEAGDGEVQSLKAFGFTGLSEKVVRCLMNDIVTRPT